MPYKNQPLRIGLIGAGYIATWHADAIASQKGAELVAVCDLSASAAQALAQPRGAVAYTSLDKMITDGNLDAVHILTTPPSHAPLARQCLEAGLHVLVEKPVALDASEARALADLAERKGRIFAPGHNFLAVPSYARLKTAIARGDLGRITSATINWHLPLAPLRSGPYGMWLLQSTPNLLFELGPHLAAFATDLFGPVEIDAVSLGKYIELESGGTRPQSWRILGRAGEVDVTITLSLVETADDRSVQVTGSAASAHLDYAQDSLIVAGDNTSDIIVNPLRKQISLAGQHMREGLVNLGRQAGSLNRKSPYGLSFQGVVAAFYTAIRSGQPDPRFSGAAAVQVTELLDQIRVRLPEDVVVPFTPARKPNPKALVIGGTGFIGRHLVRSLVAKGHDVRVVSRGRTGPFDDLADRVELVSVPLQDATKLAEAMRGVDWVFHLAKANESTWEAALQNDVGVTKAVAKAALQAGVERLVYTGTIASYDMSEEQRTITEATSFANDMRDRNIYARSKAASEAVLLEMYRDAGLPVTIARPGIVVGRGGPLQHWGIGRWHGAGAVRIWGHGKNTLPFVLAEDVADALIRMADNDRAMGESFNLIGEPMLSARGYFEAIREATGARIRVVPGSIAAYFLVDWVKYALKRYALGKKDAVRASYRDWKSRAHFSGFDNRKPKDILGWQPEESEKDFVRKGIAEANLFGF